jgi:hypothetical protein
VYKETDKELPYFLASVMLKMYNTPFEKVELIDPKRPYIVLTHQSWHWAKLSNINKKLRLWFDQTPKLEDLKKVILLQDCGAGADGRVWIASTFAGQLCALKFSLKGKTNIKGTLEKEAENWKKINGSNGRAAGSINSIFGPPRGISPPDSICSCWTLIC